MNKQIIIAFCFLGIISCKQDERLPDVSGISIEPKLIRFEQELFQGDTSQMQSLIEQLNVKYPAFSDVFFERIIADPTLGNDRTSSVQDFVRDSFIQVLYQDCQNIYGDFSPYLKGLEKGLQYFKYYFPDKPVPDIYTCITGFEYGSFTVGDEVLAIGLDFYLGADYPNYHPDLFPEYITTSMTTEYLVAKSIQTLVLNYLGENTGNRLIDYMIHNGKELYIKKKFLPNVPDTIIFEYTDDQLGWLEDNESQIWAHLIQEDLLLSTNYRAFQKIVSPSPNVPNMPPDAPGRLGNWIGEKIVDRFMQRYPDTTLDDLMHLDDAQKILAESKYRPRQ